jgi:uncharacterized membrane protein
MLDAPDQPPAAAETDAAGSGWLPTPHRLYGLADGVFAISMTLLALEVRLPEDLPDSAAGFSEGAVELYQQYGVFLLAFVITARFWLSNHRMLARLHHVDDGLLERVVPFLAGICSLPIATSVLIRYGSSAEAVTFTSVLLAATSLFSARLWWYLSDPQRRLADPGRRSRGAGMGDLLFNVGVFLLAVPVAYLLPELTGLSSSWAPLVWLALLLDNQFIRLVKRLRQR